jgi:hypothetical protein
VSFTGEEKSAGQIVGHAELLAELNKVGEAKGVNNETRQEADDM